MDGAPTRNNARRDFYERIGGLSMAPLWEQLHQLVPSPPLVTILVPTGGALAVDFAIRATRGAAPIRLVEVLDGETPVTKANQAAIRRV